MPDITEGTTQAGDGNTENIVDNDTTTQGTALDTSTEATEGQVEPGTEETPTAQTETPEDADSEDNVADLDDDTLDALAELYGDKFLQSKTLKQRIDKAIEQQVQEQVNRQQRALQGQTEVERLISQGKQAVDKMAQFAQAAKTELDKASRDEEFSAEVFNPQSFMTELSSYGTAIVAEVSSRYDAAIQDTLQEVLSSKLPPLSSDNQGEILKIVGTAERMEGDPRQAPNAKGYFVSAIVGFLVDRALEAGAIVERERLGKRGTVSKKIADANAIKTAAAKITKNRGNPPPKTPAAEVASSNAHLTTYDSEHYRKLKKEDPQKAQEYVDSFGRGRVSIAP